MWSELENAESQDINSEQEEDNAEENVLIAQFPEKSEVLQASDRAINKAANIIAFSRNFGNDALGQGGHRDRIYGLFQEAVNGGNVESMLKALNKQLHGQGIEVYYNGGGAFSMLDRNGGVDMMQVQY